MVNSIHFLNQNSHVSESDQTTGCCCDILTKKQQGIETPAEHMLCNNLFKLILTLVRIKIATRTQRIVCYRNQTEKLLPYQLFWLCKCWRWWKARPKRRVQSTAPSWRWKQVVVLFSEWIRKWRERVELVTVGKLAPSLTEYKNPPLPSAVDRKERRRKE